MKTIILVLTNVLFLNLATAGQLSNSPLKTDTGEFQKYMSLLKDYDLPEPQVISYDAVIYSPNRTRKIYIKSTDPATVPYDKSHTTITAVGAGGPLGIIELKGYRSFNVNWINDDILHIQSWPGRCIQLDEIVDILNKAKLYEAAYNHCGVSE